MNFKKMIHELMSAWNFSKSLAVKLKCSRTSTFIHLVSYYIHYRITVNDYQKLALASLDVEKRKDIAEKHYFVILKRREWSKDYYENNRFLAKWSDKKMGATPSLKHKRIEMYRKRYNMGQSCILEHNVLIERHHFLFGTIKIGNNVLFAKNVCIDYSGEVEIHNDVKFSNGAILLSHTHPLFSDPSNSPSVATPCKIIIEQGVNVGSGSIILDSCSCIGRHARIAAGAVVRNPVPPYSVVVGNPAKIVGFVYTPEEVESFEKVNFPENERISLEKYRKLYEKHFVDNMKSIKIYLSNY